MSAVDAMQTLRMHMCRLKKPAKIASFTTEENMLKLTHDDISLLSYACQYAPEVLRQKGYEALARSIEKLSEKVHKLDMNLCYGHLAQDECRKSIEEAMGASPYSISSLYTNYNQPL